MEERNLDEKEKKKGKRIRKMNIYITILIRSNFY